MAKPIESIPVVEGKDAETLLEDLSRPENITETEKKFFKEVKEIK